MIKHKEWVRTYFIIPAVSIFILIVLMSIFSNLGNRFNAIGEAFNIFNWGTLKAPAIVASLAVVITILIGVAITIFICYLTFITKDYSLLYIAIFVLILSIIIAMFITGYSSNYGVDIINNTAVAIIAYILLIIATVTLNIALIIVLLRAIDQVKENKEKKVYMNGTDDIQNIHEALGLRTTAEIISEYPSHIGSSSSKDFDIKEYKLSEMDVISLGVIESHKSKLDFEKFDLSISQTSSDDLITYILSKPGTGLTNENKGLSIYKVKNKTLAMLRKSNSTSIVFKCGASIGDELVRKTNYIVAPASFPARLGWYTITDIRNLDFEILKLLVDISYRLAVKNY